MPLPAYLTIEGTEQGLISLGALGEASAGSARQIEHENEILVLAFDHSLFATPGTTSGRRKHTPLIITKALDKASLLRVLKQLTARQELYYWRT